MEEVAFSDWPGQTIGTMDVNGTNSWMPAYGFQTPRGLLEREDFLGNPDAEYFLHGNSNSCLYLETIHEETSDDLRSDSDVSNSRGSPSGWLTTDSETDSVICMDQNNDSDSDSDRELACPSKRRRHDPPRPPSPRDDSPLQSLSRSSSLLQFETLEKQCQETSSSSPSVYSHSSTRPKKSSDSDSSGGSELTLAPSKSMSSLRAWKSTENLSRRIVSAENLSEDSGFGELRQRGSFGAYDCEISGTLGGKFGASCQNLHAGFGSSVPDSSLNLDQECSKFSSSSEPNLAERSEPGVNLACSVPKNLDLVAQDDGLNSIAAKNWDLGKLHQDLGMAFRREGSYAEAMRHRVDLSDDEGSLCYRRKLPKTTIVEFDQKVLQVISESVSSLSVADAQLDSIYGLPGKRSVASTPNLVMTQKEQERFVDLMLDEERRRSVQDLPRKSSLANHSTSTSCVSDVEEKTLNESGSTKEVHFSPVVSEVNWPEDSSPSTAPEPESNSSSSFSSTPDREVEALAKALLHHGSPKPVPLHRPIPESRRPVRPPPNDLNAFPPYDEPHQSPLSYRPVPSTGRSIGVLSESQPDLRRANFRSNFSQSQPDVRKRRGSQLIKRDSDGCIIKAYVDGDGIQYKHTHLELEELGHVAPHPPTHPHATAITSTSVPSLATTKRGNDKTAVAPGMDAALHQPQSQPQQPQQTKKKLGGFFSRLASFRFSNRKDDKNRKNKESAEKRTGNVSAHSQRVATKDDYIYIPLKDPSSSAPNAATAAAAAKPPLPRAPPRVVGACVKTTPTSDQTCNASSRHQRRRTIDHPSSAAAAAATTIAPCCPRPMAEPMGLIETDIDTQVTHVIAAPDFAAGVSSAASAAANVKTRSLLDLGVSGGAAALDRRLQDVVDGRSRLGDGDDHRQRPHKSMEFLLDKQNLKVVEPPENELQKSDRVMSEHQLRVQRSLQKLAVPDWYKQNQVPQGFILKRSPTNQQTPRWTGTASSKTTSLSSLGSVGSPSPLVLSPTSGAQPFVRWSTSKLNSTASSPCASTRSSFNRQANGSISPSSVRSSFSYRQPYLGWRSQERLNKPRTPAERLANSLLQENHRRQERQEQQEIQTSIKEVTSAIVHYVSGLRPESDESRSRSTSPRGSQKLCWLESSFVGIKPLDSPQTPVTLGEGAATSTPHSQSGAGLRLDLQTHNDVSYISPGPKPSPGSTTLEDVLDSLLGLPSTERAPSPSLQVTASANTSPSNRPPSIRRRSEGNDPFAPPSRRVSFQATPPLQCRYSRCGKTVAVDSAEAANFKSCHNCTYTYCSRACRRAHWEKHRKTCLFSRIGTLCRQVIAAVKEQKDSLYNVSLVARRGYLSHGTGAVKCFFPCPEAAEKFLQQGLQHLGELTYVRWADLLPSEMGPQLYSELVHMCKTYNPETRLVLYVSVCVVSETPASGAVKWERQLVSRCAKMRLGKDQECDGPETLVLHSSPLEELSEERLLHQRRRAVEGVAKEVRLRGVSLKRQHPHIWRRLLAYADGTCDRLAPIIVYPKVASGRSFICIIMLEAELASVRQVEGAGIKARTVDVLACE